MTKTEKQHKDKLANIGCMFSRKTIDIYRYFASKKIAKMRKNSHAYGKISEPVKLLQSNTSSNHQCSKGTYDS